MTNRSVCHAKAYNGEELQHLPLMYSSGDNMLPIKEEKETIQNRVKIFFSFFNIMGLDPLDSFLCSFC